MYVKPAENPNYDSAKHPAAHSVLQVYDPALKNYLPPEGRDVGDTHRFYWLRRARDKDVIPMSDNEGLASVAAADAARAKAAASDSKKQAAATSATVSKSGA